jgi:uncharacterized membrane protein
MTTGLTAGVFADWSNTIMPGLSTVDDRTFVATFQALDAAITNPLFLGVGLTGALLTTGWAVVLLAGAKQRPATMWVTAALACYLLVLVITFAVHEPLNVTVRDAGDPAAIDVAAVRAELDEAMWTTWNTIRALAATAAFGFLCWALVIHRRPARFPANSGPTMSDSVG